MLYRIYIAFMIIVKGKFYAKARVVVFSLSDNFVFLVALVTFVAVFVAFFSSAIFLLF